MCLHSSYQCALAIANIGVIMTCDDAPLATALRQRYAAFPLHDQIHLQLHVRLVDAAGPPHPDDLQVVIDGDSIRHSRPGRTCSIDIGTGRGELVVAPPYALEEIEYWLRVAYALLVFRAGGLLFHAAGIVRGGRAWLFCGRSGSGKTTVARVSPRPVVLNDDLVVLMPHRDGWTVHATPFSNPTQVPPSGASSAPLAAILRLVQSKTVALEPLRGGLALAELITNVPVLSVDPAVSHMVIERCQQVLNVVPMYYLHFLPDASFWPVVEATVGAVPLQR